MPDLMHATDQPSLSSLVGGLIDDIQRLFRQELALARSEVFNEWNKTKTATALLAGGGAALALGILLLAFTVVKLIALALPEWASFLIVGGVIAILGGALISSGLATLRRIRLVPDRTVHSLEEDLHAVSHAVSTERSTLTPGASH